MTAPQSGECQEARATMEQSKRLRLLIADAQAQLETSLDLLDAEIARHESRKTGECS